MGSVAAAFAVLAGVALLAACGGGGGGGGSSLSFPVSVKVTGLSSGTLTLHDNGSDSVTVYGSTTSSFGAQIAAGSLYDVTVAQQPAGQNCVVLGGAGAANGNVTVNVVCSPSGVSPAPASTQWTWMAGSQTQDLIGSYGTVGVPGGFPGARYGAASWADGAGNLWLFGGDAVVSSSAVGFFNDLWKYDTASGTWTWWGPAASANTPYQSGVVAGSSSYPGARIFPSTWYNKATGQAWLFGGFGCGSSSTCNSSSVSVQNDLWTFTPSGGWAQISAGLSTASSSYPGARFGAATWIDSAGNLWLFGGIGVAVDGSRGNLGDLWEYVPGTRSWTVVSGPHSASMLPPSGTNTCSSSSPPARENATSWFDGANLWLFGGGAESGSNSSTTETFFADLWEYSPSTGNWACWPGNPPVAGGSPLPSYTPAARYEAVSWVDPNTGYLWLYGGEGYIGPGAGSGTPGYLNDLWYLDPQTQPSPGTVQQWTQVSALDTQGGCTTTPGSSTASPWCPGVYGSQGASGTSNLPGARYGAAGWVDANGDFWLFGGDGYGSPTNTVGDLNDLWRYAP